MLIVRVDISIREKVDGSDSMLMSTLHRERIHMDSEDKWHFAAEYVVLEAWLFYYK